MIYKKYEFQTKKLLNDKLKKLNSSNEPIKLNKLTIEQGVYDGEKVVKEPVFSKGYCVDVVWSTEVSKDWNEYEINPKNPKHKIS
ncbi:MAG: hypothetical protein COB83_07210 [Gammaproteobacteria bacterium]|nr:MAG: hypothetical protein COB83_07210 [Gammaproteobacteria bacterium]